MKQKVVVGLNELYERPGNIFLNIDWIKLKKQYSF